MSWVQIPLSPKETFDLLKLFSTPPISTGRRGVDVKLHCRGGFCKTIRPPAAGLQKNTLEKGYAEQVESPTVLAPIKLLLPVAAAVADI